MKRRIPPHHLAALRRSDTPAPLAAALATSLLPLLGVWLLHWPVVAVIGLYWLDNVIIGVFHGLRMLSAQGRLLDPDYEAALAASSAHSIEERRQMIANAGNLQHFVMPGVFVLHYGAFCAGHALFIALLFDGAFSGWGNALFLVTVAIMVLQQARELRRFHADPELRALPRVLLMFQPYPRVIALHLALLFGAVPALFGHPLIAALLLAGIRFWAERSGALSIVALLERRNADATT